MLWRSGESDTTTDSDTITSPFYPNPYPTNVFCRYTLVAQPHERVRIVFADFDLNYPHGNPNDPYRYFSFIGGTKGELGSLSQTRTETRSFRTRKRALHVYSVFARCRPTQSCCGVNPSVCLNYTPAYNYTTYSTLHLFGVGK